MNQEIKTKWVEALRSGKFKQTDGALCRIQGNTCSYCCLGVLLDICDVEKDNPHLLDRYTYHYNGSQSWFRLPVQFRDYVGLNEDDVGTLMTLNDDYTPFSEIADYIEKNL